MKDYEPSNQHPPSYIHTRTDGNKATVLALFKCESIQKEDTYMANGKYLVYFQSNSKNDNFQTNVIYVLNGQVGVHEHIMVLLYF